MKKIFTLMIAIFAMAGTVNAKTVTTVTTLWEGTDDGSDINIPKSSLVAGATIKLDFNWVGSDGAQFSCFYYDGGWKKIYNWQWVNNGESFSFSLTQEQINAIPSELGFKTEVKDKMTFKKITQTVTSSETETSTTDVWSGTHDLANWSGLDLSGNTYKTILVNAKVGDILKVTYTSDEAGNINFCNGSGWATLTDGSFSVSTTDVSTNVEYEIKDATNLEYIQYNGLAINGTNAVISKVELLTYASSYDAVSVTIGSDGIATFSCGKKLNFSGTGVTPYYASAVASGTVTLTSTTTTWDNQGFIVKGNEGTYTIPVTDNATYQNTDYLKAQVNSGTVTASTTDMYHYIFAKKKTGDANIGFYKLTADHTLGAKKAYLETTTDITPSDPANSRGITLDFGDGTTAILDVFQDETHQNTLREDGKYYTLQGTCVERPTKGLYILNGKKVLVK